MRTYQHTVPVPTANRQSYFVGQSTQDTNTDTNKPSRDTNHGHCQTTTQAATQTTNDTTTNKQTTKVVSLQSYITVTVDSRPPSSSLWHYNKHQTTDEQPTINQPTSDQQSNNKSGEHTALEYNTRVQYDNSSLVYILIALITFGNHEVDCYPICCQIAIHDSFLQQQPTTNRPTDRQQTNRPKTNNNDQQQRPTDQECCGQPTNQPTYQPTTLTSPHPTPLTHQPTSRSHLTVITHRHRHRHSLTHCHSLTHLTVFEHIVTLTHSLTHSLTVCARQSLSVSDPLPEDVTDD